MIELWYGDKMRVGHLGYVQHDLNILGHLIDRDSSISLTYSLNGGPPIPLSTHVFRRIVELGDFNADIPLRDLADGSNEVVLRAIDANDRSTEVAVSIEKVDGAYALPATIGWGGVQSLEDVGMATDGKWYCDTEGLHTAQAGYDRVFLIGNELWKDYLIETTATVHALSPAAGAQSGNVYHVGFCLRWLGHSLEDNSPGEQPKWGLHPRGALTVLTVRDRRLPAYIEFFPGDTDEHRQYGTYNLIFGEPIRMKARCETLPDRSDGHGVSRYSFKAWNPSKPEPSDWNFEVTQTNQSALRSGGVVLLAHETDVTFGDVLITEL